MSFSDLIFIMNYNNVNALQCLQVFFPCVKMSENGSNHHYVICFNLKKGDIDILDNIDNGIENIKERYGNYATALVSITKNTKIFFTASKCYN